MVQPLVSILIPAYNAEKWLPETIRSALGQSWRNREIIVVDDGSRDRTLTVARSFECGSVKVASQQNRGAAAARNTALSLAQGDYLQWLDADDLLAPDKIERQLERRGDGDDRTLLSSSFGRFFYRPQKAWFVPSSLWQDLTPLDWFLRKFSDDVSMILPAWLVSRRLTDEAGRWNEDLSLDDDGEYFSRVIRASGMILFAPQARSYYRQTNSASISRTVNSRTCRSLFTSYRLCIERLLELEESQRTRQAAVRFLQNNLIYFYPEEQELLGEIHELAGRLGGTLSVPRLGSKYELIRRLAGWRTAKNAAFGLRQFKQNILMHCDRFGYRWSGSVLPDPGR